MNHDLAPILESLNSTVMDMNQTLGGVCEEVKGMRCVIDDVNEKMFIGNGMPSVMTRLSLLENQDRRMTAMDNRLGVRIEKQNRINLAGWWKTGIAMIGGLTAIIVAIISYYAKH